MLTTAPADQVARPKHSMRAGEQARRLVRLEGGRGEFGAGMTMAMARGGDISLPYSTEIAPTCRNRATHSRPSLCPLRSPSTEQNAIAMRDRPQSYEATALRFRCEEPCWPRAAKLCMPELAERAEPIGTAQCRACWPSQPQCASRGLALDRELKRGVTPILDLLVSTSLRCAAHPPPTHTQSVRPPSPPIHSRTGVRIHRQREREREQESTHTHTSRQAYALALAPAATAAGDQLTAPLRAPTERQGRAATPCAPSQGARW